MFNYFLHLLIAKGPDRVHSPFIFDLYFHTLKGKYTHPKFDKIEKKHNSKRSDIIGQSIFKIVNKYKPQKALLISDHTVKQSDYIFHAKKTTHIDCLLGANVDKSILIKNSTITVLKKQLNQLSPENYDLIVIDVKSNELELNINHLQKCKMIIVTGIKDQSKEIWSKIKSSQEHNILIDFYFFGISIKRYEQKKEYFLLRL